jgi:hypothetical protein
MLICLLMYRYGFLKKHALLKIVVLCLFLLTCIELSIYKAHLNNTEVGIEIVLFLFVFLAIIYIAYKEELDKILFYEKKAKKLINETIEKNTQLQTLIQTREQEKKLLEAQMQGTKQKLKLIDQELIKLKKKEEPFDLERCNLTRREYKIIEYLVTEKASNKEIAKKFTITIPTVKNISPIFMTK